jgi:heme exporter protein A
MSSNYFTYDIKLPDSSVKRLSFSTDDQPQGANIVRLSGRNGSGKTTLLHLLSGLLEPDIGQSPYVSTHNLFYLPHHSGLRSTLTVFENLDYWASVSGINLKDHANNLEKTIEIFELKQFMDRPVRQLSAGQQRRAALLRLALVQDRSVWLLDEPESNLDGTMITRLGEVVTQYTKQGGSVIWATHLPTLPIAGDQETIQDIIKEIIL